jgi:hypothetical protein
MRHLSRSKALMHEECSCWSTCSGIVDRSQAFIGLDEGCSSSHPCSDDGATSPYEYSIMTTSMTLDTLAISVATTARHMPPHHVWKNSLLVGLVSRFSPNQLHFYTSTLRFDPGDFGTLDLQELPGAFYLSSGRAPGRSRQLQRRPENA